MPKSKENQKKKDMFVPKQTNEKSEECFKMHTLRFVVSKILSVGGGKGYNFTHDSETINYLTDGPVWLPERIGDHL